MRGSYKDDRTSNHVDVFSLERGRKRTYKGFQYFCQGHDQGSCGKHLFLLWLIFCTVLHTGQLTIKHFDIFEHEVNRTGIFEKVNIPKATIHQDWNSIRKPFKFNLIDGFEGSIHVWKSVCAKVWSLQNFQTLQIKSQLKNPFANNGRMGYMESPEL